MQEMEAMAKKETQFYNFFLEYLLDNEPEKTISKIGIKNRKILFPITRRLAGPVCGTKGILVDKVPLPKGPKIFAVTHTNNTEDISWALSFAGESAYLFCNGYNELMYTSEGIAMWLAGVIYVDRYDKVNRQASVKKAERVLNYGGNVMIFPEGVWNMSENLLVRKMYPGVYRIASLTKAPVIPISTMVYDNVLYAIRGEKISLHEYEINDGLTVLRDTLASMKWELMEKYGKTSRADLLKDLTPEEYWENFIKEYEATQIVYEHEVEKNDHFLDKDDFAYIEVQEAMGKLRNKYNLFQ